jgi:uncharacterized protein (DUF1919 family)
MSLASKILFRWQKMRKVSYLDKNRSKLKCDDFTVISSNCWGGILYKDLGMQYKSPFVNMYMFCDCYVKLMADLKTYMNFPLRFIDASKYLPGVAIDYPLALLNDVEIHFIHFKTREDVLSRWIERKSRINYDKIIAVMSERDGASMEALEKFDRLPYSNKLCFTMRKYPSLTSVVPLPGSLFFSETPPADQIAGVTYTKTDIIEYINRTCG